MGKMSKIRLEYIWLDGCSPEQNLRSKIKVVDKPDNYPDWSFDGSSTKQATGGDSDCVLVPATIYKNPLDGGYLLLCEVYNSRNKPHDTNNREVLPDENEWWFGFEQEYFMYKNGKPLGWPEDGYPEPQGKYYCGLDLPGRNIMEEHLNACIEAGINIEGTNAEVALGQWEYQIFGRGCKIASDNLWISRYLLYRIAEKHSVQIELHPKPIKGDWNGSGMHVNFSNKEMRENGSEELFEDICKKLEINHELHIVLYGSDNNQRLTGLHETQRIDEFSYGVSDRGASIRIPIGVVQNNYKGYLEDRRPASNGDPYKITNIIIKTINTK
jgi:glutamine synthetase